MSYEARVYKVLISSPSDVVKERKVIPEIIYSWNAVNSEEFKVVLLPVMWETHSTPAMGERPQAIINEQIVEGSDILVGTFWTRIGTKTGEAESGTVEEIEEFIKSGKPVLLYFSSVPVDPESVDPKQYQRLKVFKQKCEKEGLIDKYYSIEELRHKLSRHLTSTVRKLGHSVNEGKAENKIDDAKSHEMVKNQLITFYNRLLAEWVAERDSDPHRIDMGKNIIYRFGDGLLEFRTLLNEIVSNEIISKIDEVIKNSRIMQKHQLFMDGGKSYKEFWENGNRLFNEINNVLEEL